MNGPLETCRICGSASLSKFQRRGADYGRCSQCGALLMLLTEQQYDDLEVSYDPDALFNTSEPRALLELLAIDDKRKVLRGPVQRLRRPARFLDIGCGQGGNLLAARSLGCIVTGVEPSTEHSLVARTAFGLDVRNCFFSADLFDEPFDMVMLSHVIEHIYDPNAFLEEVSKVVAPGGTLMVITPNAAATAAVLSGPYWTMLKSFDHVSMLTPETFQHMSALRGWQLHQRQSEYHSEAVLTLASGLRDALRERKQSPSQHDRPVAAGARKRRYVRYRRLRQVLAVLGQPLHLFNVITKRQGCLVLEARKPG